VGIYQFFPYIIFSSFSFATLIILSIYGIQYRHHVGVKEFIMVMLASAWSVFCQTFELIGTTLPVKLFWADMEYLGMMFSAFAFLLMAIRFAGYDRYITKRNVLIVTLVYTIFWALVLTDPYLGLMRTNFSLDTSAIPYTIKKDYGLIYPLYTLFIYSIIIASFSILVNVARRKDSLYRKQAVVLILYIVLMVFPNVGFYFQLLPITRYDLSPAFFGPASLLMAWSIYRHKFLNIMPIARDLLIETMNSGVIVTDGDKKIIDINQSAIELLSLEGADMLSRDISEIQPVSSLLTDSEEEQQAAFAFDNGNGKRVYEMKSQTILNKQGESTGRLIVLDDVTEQRENTQKIITQQNTLSVMRERERLGRELHDGLGQVFGYINAQAQTVREYMCQGKPDQAVKRLDELIAATRDAHGSIREYILEMRGISPRNRSFSSVLKQLAYEFSEKNGISVNIIFDDNLPESFPEDEKAINLLKIIQEALTNIRKHAGACQVEVSFQKEDGYAVICIADSGAGFDPDSQSDGHHYGLSIMRERAKEMGADLWISSQIGRGSRVTLRLPHRGEEV